MNGRTFFRYISTVTVQRIENKLTAEKSMRVLTDKSKLLKHHFGNILHYEPYQNPSSLPAEAGLTGKKTVGRFLDEKESNKDFTVLDSKKFTVNEENALRNLHKIVGFYPHLTANAAIVPESSNQAALKSNQAFGSYFLESGGTNREDIQEFISSKSAPSVKKTLG
jgi:hypothetical protein